MKRDDIGKPGGRFSLKPRHGLRLHDQADVPLYRVDPANPGVYLRIVNGVSERGVIEDGRFKVID